MDNGLVTVQVGAGSPPPTQKELSEKAMAMATKARAPREMMRLSDVCKLVKVSRQTIFRRVKGGNFPKPVNMGGGTIGFYADEISEWQEGLPRVVPKIDERTAA